jgi:hypothetical protein
MPGEQLFSKIKRSADWTKTDTESVYHSQVTAKLSLVFKNRKKINKNSGHFDRKYFFIEFFSPVEIFESGISYIIIRS